MGNTNRLISARVDELFDMQMRKRKEFLKSEFDLDVYGTRLTKELGKMMEQNIIFPLDKNMINTFKTKKNNKLKYKEIIWKMRIPYNKRENGDFLFSFF